MSFFRSIAFSPVVVISLAIIINSCNQNQPKENRQYQDCKLCKRVFSILFYSARFDNDMSLWDCGEYISPSKYFPVILDGEEESPEHNLLKYLKREQYNRLFRDTLPASATDSSAEFFPRMFSGDNTEK